MPRALKKTLPVLLLALLLAALSFAAPAPQVHADPEIGPAAQPLPVYELGVAVAPATPHTGDALTVTLTVLRDGQPSQMGLIQYRVWPEPVDAGGSPRPVVLPAELARRCWRRPSAVGRYWGFRPKSERSRG